MYVRAVAEHILWSIVVPRLAHMIVSWCNVKILEYVEYKHLSGYMIADFQRDIIEDITDFALIAGRIEGK